MRKSILSIAILAGTLCFTGIALADETETAVNRESLRVAQGIVDGGTASGAGVLGYAGSERTAGGFAGAASEERATSASDKQLFALGDRGLGNN